MIGTSGVGRAPIDSPLVAALLGCSERTVRRRAVRGEIPGAYRGPGRSWRFDRDQLTEWLAQLEDTRGSNG